MAAFQTFLIKQRSSLFTEFPQYREHFLRLARAVYFLKNDQRLDTTKFQLNPPMLVVEDPSFSQSVTYLPQYKAIIINDAQQNPTNYALGHEYTHYLDDIFGNDLSDVLSGENNANHLAYEAAKIELQTSMKSGDPDKAMQAWMKYHAFPTERRALAGGLAMFVFQGMTENQYVQEFMGIGTPNSTLSADMQSQMAVFLKGVYADAARLASFG